MPCWQAEEFTSGRPGKRTLPGHRNFSWAREPNAADTGLLPKRKPVHMRIAELEAEARGNAAGNYVVAACLAFGIGTLVERSVAAFTAVKLAGALYLVVLGIQAIRRRKALTTAFNGAAGPRGDRRAARQGFVVGVTNPKALILFGAVLPPARRGGSSSSGAPAGWR
jgi:hypothetical protein